MKYLVDTNVWLELLLDQDRVPEVRRFFHHIWGPEAALTEFTLYSIGIRRFSLVLDFADIFRPLVVEPTVLRLVNTRQMAAEDFEAIGDGVFLSEAGRKKVLKAFDATLQRTVQHRRLKRHVSYRQLFRLEAYKLVRHLVGDEPYTAFRAWW
jgi:CRISPR-associated protein Cas1